MLVEFQITITLINLSLWTMSCIVLGTEAHRVWRITIHNSKKMHLNRQPVQLYKWHLCFWEVEISSSMLTAEVIRSSISLPAVQQILITLISDLSLHRSCSFSMPVQSHFSQSIIKDKVILGLQSQGYKLKYPVWIQSASSLQNQASRFFFNCFFFFSFPQHQRLYFDGCFHERAAAAL